MVVVVDRGSHTLTPQTALLSGLVLGHFTTKSHHTGSTAHSTIPKHFHTQFQRTLMPSIFFTPSAALAGSQGRD